MTKKRKSSQHKMKKAKVVGKIITITITITQLILQMIELFKKQHDGFWTIDSCTSGLKSCGVTMGELFNFGLLLCKR